MQLAAVNANLGTLVEERVLCVVQVCKAVLVAVVGEF